VPAMDDQMRDRGDAERRIDEDGYFLMRDVVSKDKLAQLDEELRTAYERELHDGALFEGGGRISGHLNCFPGEGSRFVLDDMRSNGVLDVLRGLTPTGVDRLRVNCNINLPNSVAQHYHIDGFYVDQFYLCTVAVIDTDLVNGALDVLPGTHRRSYTYWQFALERTSRRSTRVAMRQGDVLIRKSTVWHRGMPNRSSAIRPQLTFTFDERIAPAGDPFLEYGGKITFWPNWYSTGWRGRLRETARAKAPILSSTYRFASSLVGREQ
jgi:hypothetical protein